MSILQARALTVVVLLLAAAAACGGEDGGSDTVDDGDPEAFCERLQELDESGDLDLDDAEAVEAFDDLVDLAPEEIDSDANRIQRAFEELSELNEDDPDAFGAAFEIILDPRLTSSLEDFAEYAEDECGLEVEEPDALGDFSDDLSGDLTSDFSDDFSGDLTDDLSDDISPASELRAYLEAEYPDYSRLATGIGTVETGEAAVQVTLSLGQTTDADTAVAICEATVEWAGDVELEAIEVEVEDQEDIVLATGDLDGGCEAA